MDQRLSRRGLFGAVLTTYAAASGGAALAQSVLDSVARKVPRALRPLVAQIPREMLEFAEAVRKLEQEAEALSLPPSVLSPRTIASLPLDPDRLYEAALPRLVALVDRAEARNIPFADRAGGVLARLHATQRVVPEGLGGAILGRAPVERRGVLLAMADPAPALPGQGTGQVPPLVLAGPNLDPDEPDEPDVPSPSLPGVSRSLRFGDLRDEYAAYFESARLRAEHGESSDFHLAMMRKSKPRYRAVGDRANVPWAFIGVIHALEASFNFRAHFHNGDFPLNQRTRQVPAGRPSIWLPPSDWDASAIDALKLMGFAGQEDWSIPRMLHRLEAYNGFGYRRRGLVSPYLWSFSSLYERGKFVADGRYDPRARSQQCGAATMLRLLVDTGEIPV